MSKLSKCLQCYLIIFTFLVGCSSDSNVINSDQKDLNSYQIEPDKTHAVNWSLDRDQENQFGTLVAQQLARVTAKVEFSWIVIFRSKFIGN